MLKHRLHQFNFGNRFLVFGNYFYLRYRFRIQLESYYHMWSVSEFVITLSTKVFQFFLLINTNTNTSIKTTYLVVFLFSQLFIYFFLVVYIKHQDT